MNWKTEIQSAFEAHGKALDADVLEELSQHAAMVYESSRARGDAEAAAQAAVGESIEVWLSEAATLTRQPKRVGVVVPPAGAHATMVSGLLQDIRYGLRLLVREPGATLVAILTIALGIGASTTLFSVVYGVMLKPLPWPEAERLVRVEERRGGRTGRSPWTITNGTYLGWRENPSTIEEIGGWIAVPSIVRGVGDAERIRIARMTPGAFTLLGAHPVIGRLFPESADSKAGDVVVSHGFWQRRFGGAGDVLGRVIQLDDRPFTIVGVMPQGFAFPERETQAWIPEYVRPVIEGPRTSVTIFAVLARRRPGVTIDQVAAEATARARAAPALDTAALALFGSAGEPTISAAPALDVEIAEVRPALRILLAAVVLLLATAVASVASVQLARATKRRREMTVRAALGAGWGRLTRQWMVESALMCTAGAAAGTLGTAMLHRSLPSILPADFPRLGDIHIDWSVALFATAVTFLASALCGLLPGLQSRRLVLAEALSEDGIAPVGGSLRTSAGRARAAIMTGQIAIACVLLVGGSLLGRSLLALIHMDRGYDPQNLLTVHLRPPNRTTFTQVAPAMETLRTRLRAQPGVTHVAFGNAIPLIPSVGLSGFKARSPVDPASEIQVQSLHRTVSPEYFGAMRLQPRAGRSLAETDTASSPPVLVVNRSFAKQYLGKEPISQQLVFNMYGRSSWEVVGVVDDMTQGGVYGGPGFAPASESSQPEMYSSYKQVGSMFPVSVMLLVRTSGDPAALAPIVRSLVREEAPSVVLDSIMTMEDRVMSSLARPRTYAIVLGGFSLFALAIAAAGLFGVLSYGVAQRTREIGIRTALGGQARDIVVLVLRQAFVLTAVGLGIGLTVAGLLAQLLSNILYGVRPHDIVTFVSVPMLIAIAAALACVAPALRAARLDPLKALRSM